MASGAARVAAVVRTLQESLHCARDAGLADAGLAECQELAAELVGHVERAAEARAALRGRLAQSCLEEQRAVRQLLAVRALVGPAATEGEGLGGGGGTMSVASDVWEEPPRGVEGTSTSAPARIGRLSGAVGSDGQLHARHARLAGLARRLCELEAALEGAWEYAEGNALRQEISAVK